MTPNPSLAPPSAEVVFFFHREVNYLPDGNRLKGLTEERMICMCLCHDQNAHFLVESVILGIFDSWSTTKITVQNGRDMMGWQTRCTLLRYE